MGRRSDRGVFLLVTFLCTSKEKLLAVGQPPTSGVHNSMNRAERETNRCIGNECRMDSRFRGNDGKVGTAFRAIHYSTTNISINAVTGVASSRWRSLQRSRIFCV